MYRYPRKKTANDFCDWFNDKMDREFEDQTSRFARRVRAVSPTTIENVIDYLQKSKPGRTDREIIFNIKKLLGIGYKV